MPPGADASSLAAAVLDAATPLAAAAATSRVLDYLARHAADHPRAFFADAFPSLLYRLFVSSASFIDLAAADPALTDLLLSLLAPSGPLLAAAAAADRLALIRFVFPNERLPDWLRLALASPASASASASPLLSARVGSDLHLSIFEYYLFWFAYYPVSAASPPAAPANPGLRSRSRLETWVSTLATTAIRKPGHKPESSLYLKLLYAYLTHFVPTRTPMARTGGAGTLLHRTVNDGVDALDSFARAEFLLHTLVQFWLVGDDFSPLPVQACHALGLHLPPRAHAELSERPPSPGLGDAVKLLVMYLNCCDGRALVDVDARMPSEGLPVWNGVVDKVGFWNPLIQRPLYRFVLRTFLFCPIGAAIKNATQIFSVWVAYMEPWKITQQELDGYAKQQTGEEQDLQNCNMVYTSSWKIYVLSNYLFYSSMVMHFLGFAHKFIHSDVAAVLLMVYKVLGVLSSSPELLDLLHKVDAAYHTTPVASSLPYDDVLKYVPSICEQLKDWEDGLSETDADGSFLHEHWNSDLRLFSYDENGAYNLLQLLLIRAESEILRLSGDTQQALQTLDSIKSLMKRVFQGQIERIHGNTSLEELHNQHQQQVRGEVFTPKHPSSGKSSWADVKYRGEWMKRPISDSEVAWLARILIRLSDWLNDALGLDCGDVDGSPAAASTTYIRFDRNELNTVGGPKDAARMALVALCSVIVLAGQALLKFMRSHRVKIDLRVFASKKLLSAAVVLYGVVTVTRNASG
ncbi:unnamed protein product [Urochloa decumbens]|uniref:Sphingomyelin phosphodiesterase 4 n=1 Tax=Urochloa decumbens TaxID=240449 RepID=A0ABC9H3S5_9POAL